LKPGCVRYKPQSLSSSTNSWSTNRLRVGSRCNSQQPR
jgi:hypothetical protein